MNLRRTLLALGLACMLASGCAGSAEDTGWPDWQVFRERFVQADGRVVDVTFGGKSTSEGQAYALFFALVANQRAQFDTILKWTSDNLAGGRLGPTLPAWYWGKGADGSWGVRETNSASDADLWLAYTLLEAARLWDAPQYAVTGHALLQSVRQHEVADAGAAGPVLLPGAYGFALSGGRYRLDPSYLPGFMFRYLADVDRDGPWQKIWSGYERMGPDIFHAGVAPDLFVVDSRGRVTPDSEHEPSGSYDAIRVYLWAGMSGAEDLALVRRLAPYAALTRQLGAPPERVNPATGAALKSDYSPLGYSGAVLPFLSALGAADALAAQQSRLRSAAMRARLGEPTNYYDQVLTLFGKGWTDHQYQFVEHGRLKPRWAH